MEIQTQKLRLHMLPQGGVKILIVDDEPDFADLVMQQFESRIDGYNVQFVFALNGVEALKKINENKDISIVLTDLNMPEMDGLSLLSQISKMPRLIKTIVVSAYGDMKNIRRAMNNGAFDFVTKPIDFRDLEITIGRTIDVVSQMKESIKEHEELISIENELIIAKSIQNSLIPHDFSSIFEQQSFELFGKMIAAKYIGGDLFDFFPLPENKVGFVIADVSGKGIPAALFMSMTRAAIRSFSIKSVSPAECLYQVNNFLELDNESCMFVTLFYGVLDSKTGHLVYTNAGHFPPYLQMKDGTLLPTKLNLGMALGIEKNETFKNIELEMREGDTLLLYTDGVIDSLNKSYEMFGEKRLIEVIQREKNKPLTQLVDNIIDEIKGFSQNMEQYDDITLLAIRHEPSPQKDRKS